MRERIFLRQNQKDKKLKQLEHAQQIEAEKNLKYSVFKVARMLALHQLISAIFGGKK